MDGVRKEFSVHMLNGDGKGRAASIAHGFSRLLDQLESHMTGDPRCAAIVRTKLEEAAFFAKKAMATDPANQEPA